MEFPVCSKANLSVTQQQAWHWSKVHGNQARPLIKGGTVFVELMPLLAGRTVLITVAKVDDKTLRVNVIPAQAKADENPALTTPLTYTGSPEELDAELGKHLAGYVQTHQQTASTLAEARATMEAAAKAAQEEAKRKAEERRKATHKPLDKGTTAAAEPASTASSASAAPPDIAPASATAATRGLFGATSPEAASTQSKGGLAL
jgi:PRTRC genetic system protein E